MSKLPVMVVMGIALVAWSQVRTVKALPRTPSSPPVRPSLTVPRIDKGTVEGKTYKNPSIGLELIPASGLELGTPELKGTPGTGSGVLTVMALGEPKWFSTRDSMSLVVDVLTSNPPNERSAEAGMRKVIKGFSEGGFEPVRAPHEGRLSGMSFLRQDGTKGSDSWTLMTKTCDTLELLFVFTGSGQDEVDKLIASTRLKIDLARTGCSLNSNDAAR